MLKYSQKKEYFMSVSSVKGLVVDVQLEQNRIDAPLEVMSKTLHKAKDKDRIVIDYTPNSLAVKVQNVFWHWVCYFLSWMLPWVSNFFPKSFKAENRKTIEAFRMLLGEKRFTELSRRYLLDLEGKQERGESISKRTVERLICGIGDIRLVDLEQLFTEIKQSSGNIRYLSEGVSKAVRHHFAAKSSLENLSREEIDLLYEILIPVTKIETLFLNNMPKIDSYFQRNVRTRVAMTELLRRQEWKEFKNPTVDCLTVLLKRVLEHTTPDGVIIPCNDGYYTLHDKLARGGAYCMLLKTVAKPDSENDYRSKVLFLSTRSRVLDWQTTLSFLGMFESNLGANGVKEIYPLLINKIKNVKAGFVRSENEQLDLGGFSQGSTQAERVFTLDPLFPHFKKAYFLSGPGIEVVNHQHFKKLTDASMSKKEIHYIIHHHDQIFDAGQGHIGIDVDPEKVKISLHEINRKKQSSGDDRDSVPDSPKIYLALRNSFFDHGMSHLFDTGRPPDDFVHRITTNDNDRGNRRIQTVLNMHADPGRRHVESFWRQLTAIGAPDDFLAFREAIAQS
jgi:hypothetical protein